MIWFGSAPEANVHIYSCLAGDVDRILGELKLEVRGRLDARRKCLARACGVAARDL
jgi:hypothetical protein